MPNIGTPELVIILVIVLLIFGVGKLPDVFKALGSGVREFRDAASNEPANSETNTDTKSDATTDTTSNA